MSRVATALGFDGANRKHELVTFGLLRLEQTGERRFRLAVRDEISTPFGRMYGGIGVAACAEAAEVVAERPLQWITTQFIGSTMPPEVIDLDVSVPAHGRATTQTRVVCTVDGREVFTSLCAHTQRPGGDSAQFVEMPGVPGPHDCTSDPFASAPRGSFLDQIERRLATVDGSGALRPFPDGRVALWCRIRSEMIGSPATQSFVTDVIPLAVCAALGVSPGGTSLDHTVRIVDPEPSEWALLELVPEGFHRATGHGSLRVWSEEGRLMGIAQQSSIIRPDQLVPR